MTASMQIGNEVETVEESKGNSSSGKKNLNLRQAYKSLEPHLNLHETSSINNVSYNQLIFKSLTPNWARCLFAHFS